MSAYITVNRREEVIERIQHINDIIENRKDIAAQYEEAKKMNPLSNIKGAGDIKSSSSGASLNCDIPIVMSMAKESLQRRLWGYDIMIADYKRGMNMLNEEEAKIIDMLYVQRRSVKKVANDLNMDRSTIYRKRDTAMRKLENEILNI